MDEDNGDDNDNGNDTTDNTAEPSNRCNIDEPCAGEKDNDKDNKTTDNTAMSNSNTPIVLVTIAAILSMFTATR